jgi:integrase
MAAKKLERAPRQRAPNGAGSVYWDEQRQGYVGSISLGSRPDGSRIRPVVLGRTATEAWEKLDVLKHEVDSGIDPSRNYTVADAAHDFLANGTRRLAQKSIDDLRYHVETRIIPSLGDVRLKRLRADQVDTWLNDMAADMAASSIKKRLSTLRQIIRFAEARGRVERNVAKLVDPPRGTPGRPSKALDLAQIRALLAASQGKPIGAYIAISALTGIRTEEARPLEWRHLHLNPVKSQTCSCGHVHDHDLPPHVEVWRSVREGGDTKTPKSRRTSALPQLVIDLLRDHQVRQRQWRAVHGWKSVGIVYVFGTRHDTVPHAQVIRKQFRDVVAKAEIAGSWTPRELRHTYVSILSDRGAPIELIADLVGHKDIATTRMVYRHQLRPVITGGAELIDDAMSDWTWDLKGQNIG